MIDGARDPSLALLFICFRIFRILCLTPSELEPEREIFQSTIIRFGEQITFPDEVLFAQASFPGSLISGSHLRATEFNIRICDFLVQIAGPHRPDATHQQLLDYAPQSAGDPSLPMQRVALFLKHGAGQLSADLMPGPRYDIQYVRRPDRLRGAVMANLQYVVRGYFRECSRYRYIGSSAIIVNPSR
jgi:hypothetical protein